MEDNERTRHTGAAVVIRRGSARGATGHEVQVQGERTARIAHAERGLMRGRGQRGRQEDRAHRNAGLREIRAAFILLATHGGHFASSAICRKGAELRNFTLHHRLCSPSLNLELSSPPAMFVYRWTLRTFWSPPLVVCGNLVALPPEVVGLALYGFSLLLPL